MMDETRVWKALVSYLEASSWQIICTCPPGATSYIYPSCSFKNNDTGLDAPDLVAFKDGSLLIAECKPSVSDLIRPNRSGESDLDKLARIAVNFERGDYNSIFLKDYNLDVQKVKTLILGVCYAEPHKALNKSVTHFIVSLGLAVTEHHEALAK